MLKSIDGAVIDFGSTYTKAGYCSDNAPRIVIRSVKVKPKYPNGTMILKPKFHLNLAYLSFGMYKFENIINKGNFTDPINIEHLFNHIMDDEFYMPAEEFKYVLSENIFNPSSYREKVAESLFESFNIPGLTFQNQNFANLLASGQTTGMTLNSGGGLTTFAEFENSILDEKTVVRSDFGGNDLDKYLQTHINCPDYRFSSSSDLELIRSIKEEKCTCSRQNTEFKENIKYTLPNGCVTKLIDFPFSLTEAIFNPKEINSKELGIEGILKTLTKQNRLRSNKLLVSGGMMHSTGFSSRLKETIEKLDLTQISSIEEINSIHKGFSIISEFSTFESQWISQEVYYEEGSRCLLKT